MKIKLAGFNVDAEALDALDVDAFTPETLSAAYARISRDPADVGELRRQARGDIKKARKSCKTIVFGYGHASIAEHSVFNFDISGVSRLAVEAVEHARLCLSGDAELVSFPAPSGPSVKWTLSELYERYMDKSRPHTLNRVRLRSVNDDGILVPGKIRAIYRTGVKKVYAITTRCGRTLKATGQHKILTPGGWMALKNLNVGDLVVANGLPAYKNPEWIKEMYLERNMERKDVARLAGVSDSCLAIWICKFGLQKPKSKYPNRRGGGGVTGAHSEEGKRRIGEAARARMWRGDSVKPNSGRARALRKFQAVKCIGCGSKKNLERHHVDGNPINNEEYNVLVLCDRCHKAHHLGSAVVSVYSTPIVKIEYIGEEAVYDIAMEGPFHNFIADGIVVHNCSYTEKSQRYQRLDGGYVVPKEIVDSGLDHLYTKIIEQQFEAYRQLLPILQAHHAELGTKGQAAEEDARYVLPLACEAQLGMTANARNLEYMIQRLAAHPLAEAQEIGQQLLTAASAVTPSLMRHCEPSKFATTAMADLVKWANAAPAFSNFACSRSWTLNNRVTLIDHTQDPDEMTLAGLLTHLGQQHFHTALALVRMLSVAEKQEMLSTLLQHFSVHDKLPRAWELVTFTFYVFASASCFAQLKRHRMATIIPQKYSPSDVTVPISVVDAGAVDLYNDIMSNTMSAYGDILDIAGSRVAEYVLSNASMRGVTVSMNFREFYEFCKLRLDCHAQWDIRKLAELMVDKVIAKAPVMGQLLAGKDGFDEARDMILGLAGLANA